MQRIFCPVGEVARAEETVHTDHPAGPEGEGELPEGEDQPADDAAAGEGCRNTRKEAEMLVSHTLTLVCPSLSYRKRRISTTWRRNMASSQGGGASLSTHSV